MFSFCSVQSRALPIHEAVLTAPRLAKEAKACAAQAGVCEQTRGSPRQVQAAVLTSHPVLETSGSLLVSQEPGTAEGTQVTELEQCADGVCWCTEGPEERAVAQPRCGHAAACAAASMGAAETSSAIIPASLARIP